MVCESSRAQRREPGLGAGVLRVGAPMNPSLRAGAPQLYRPDGGPCIASPGHRTSRRPCLVLSRARSELSLWRFQISIREGLAWPLPAVVA